MLGGGWCWLAVVDGGWLVGGGAWWLIDGGGLDVPLGRHVSSPDARYTCAKLQCTGQAAPNVFPEAPNESPPQCRKAVDREPNAGERRW